MSLGFIPLAPKNTYRVWDNMEMLFSKLAKHFFAIETVSARLEITRLLSIMWGELTPKEAKIVAYILVGRVGPEYLSGEFGLAEKQILKAISLKLALDPNVVQAEFAKSGDLGEVAQKLSGEAKSLFSESLTITAMYERLLDLSNLIGSGSASSKLAILGDLIAQSSPLEARYLARLPTGQLRMGSSNMTIIDSLSWYLVGDKSHSVTIEGAFQVRPDLGEIAKLVVEGKIEEVKNITPELFVPVRMMRAQRADSGEDILSHSSPVYVEPKYDGFRLQVHLDKVTGKFMIFSRGLEEVGKTYVDVGENLLANFKGNNAIFEGEAVGYDPVSLELVPFQETITRKRKFGLEEAIASVPLRFHVFDVLLLNGKSIVNEPLATRRGLIDENIKGDELKIIPAPYAVISDANDIDEIFDKYILEGLEGIMAKIPNDPYRAGARGWSWMKLKNSYSAKVNDTLDLLVMGFDYGRGKRVGFGAGAFLVGVFDRKIDKFVTIAKIGTGLTDDEWRRIASLEANFASKICPEEYQVDKSMTCDVWLTPHTVVEIRSDEITRSQMHTAGREIVTREKGVQEVKKAGYALRFPRLEKFRDDKNPSEVTTVDEIEKIIKNK